MILLRVDILRLHLFIRVALVSNKIFLIVRLVFHSFVTEVKKLTQTSRLQEDECQAEENGLQISSAFSLNPDTVSSGRPTASFNPGRGSGSIDQLVQNGDTGSHNRTGNNYSVRKLLVSLSDCDLTGGFKLQSLLFSLSS